MKLAIAVIHGMGSEDQFFSVELKHRITEEYVNEEEGRHEDDLIFQEIYWGDLVKERQSSLLKKTNYKKDLTYMNLRELFVDHLGATLAYRTSMYDVIHSRVRDNLAKLCTHRRVDAENTPLVILAHSFGSIVMSDYIYDIQKQQAELADGKIDGISNLEQFRTLAGLITFGTPMALFSLQEDTGFDKAINVVGAELPDGIKERVKWDNYYDKDDIIAYPLKGINDTYGEAINGDYEINVGSAATSWNPACHNGYWEDKDFYKPVAKYLAELRAEHTFWK
ncbi:MAG: hypothetical protein DRQ47_06345 [Gammaproteobacteria bacterium]|nr:MAG: hypothetical protein DRQ47_06345 [Gammaproteobacteria bacterium]